MENQNLELLEYIVHELKNKIIEHMSEHRIVDSHVDNMLNDFDKKITQFSEKIKMIDNWIEEEKQLKREIRQDQRITKRWIIGLAVTTGLSIITLLSSYIIKGGF